MEPRARRLVPNPRPDVTASIQCIDCAWSAVHFGENAFEVSAFLQQLYRRHLAERHPDLTFEERPS